MRRLQKTLRRIERNTRHPKTTEIVNNHIRRTVVNIHVQARRRHRCATCCDTGIIGIPVFSRRTRLRIGSRAAQCPNNCAATNRFKGDFTFG